MLLTETEELKLLQLLTHEELLAIPPKLSEIWNPKYRNVVLTGGRGSAKSWSVAKVLIDRATEKKLKILCTREIQESIRESVYELLVETIERLQAPGWVIKEKELVNKITGSKITFRGLRDLRAAKQLKSYENYDIIWVEEADAVIKENWTTIIPTFRKPGSQIFATFNRYSEFDPVYEEFGIEPDEDTLYIEINWRDNPWFPEVLEKERVKLKKKDYDLYLHVYENYPIAQLEKAAISRKVVNGAEERVIENPEGKEVVGADIARFGGDSIIFYKRKGLKIIDRYETKYQNSRETTRELAAFAGKYKGILINIDNGGLGAGGVIDGICEMGFDNVNGINFGGTPKDKKEYKNIISEMYFEVGEILKDADIPKIKELNEDLTGRLYKYTNTQQKWIEVKDEFKKRYKRSPDDGDAVLLCFYDSGATLKMSKKHQDEMKERRMRNKRKGRLIL